MKVKDDTVFEDKGKGNSSRKRYEIERRGKGMEERSDQQERCHKGKGEGKKITIEIVLNSKVKRDKRREKG